MGGLPGESGTGLDPMARNASGHRGIARWDASRYAGLSAFGDPKDVLSAIVRGVVGRRAQRRGGAALFAQVAQSQRLNALRDSRSFTAFEASLRIALVDLGCIARA